MLDGSRHVDLSINIGSYFSCLTRGCERRLGHERARMRGLNVTRPEVLSRFKARTTKGQTLKGPYSWAQSADVTSKVNSRAFARHIWQNLRSPVFLCLQRSGSEVLGIDLSSGMLNEARRRVPNTIFRKMDLRSPQFPPNSIGGIWACASLPLAASGCVSSILTNDCSNPGSSSFCPWSTLPNVDICTFSSWRVP